MKNRLIQNCKFSQRWFHFFLITVLIFGLVFRFANLGKKVYWFDEVYTSLRVAGYTEQEVVESVSNRPEITAKELQTYQHISSSRTVFDTLRSLVLEDPQHPPLYYLLLRCWMKVWGDSIGIIRSFTALTSLLMFPAIYWLCLELLGSPLLGWVAIAFIAVSPFHVAFAQEAREYTLWTVTILLSSASFLRAIRLNTPMSWGLYSLTIGLGLYAFPLTGLVVMGYGIYLMVLEWCQFRRTLINYCLSSLAGCLLFTPWIWVILTNFKRINHTTAWADQGSNLFALVKSLVGDLSRVFIDLGLQGYSHYTNQLTYFLILLGLTVLILVGYALYFLCRTTPQRVWLFLLTLIGVITLSLILPDLILGGSRSTAGRYLIPAYLGIQIVVAYLFTTQITSLSITRKQQKLWQFLLVALLSTGVLSCAVSSQADTGWVKALDYYNPAVSRIINQSTHPLILSDERIAHLLSLSYLLPPNVPFILNPPCYTCPLDASPQVHLKVPNHDNTFSDIFLFRPSQLLKNQFEQEYQLERLSQEGNLWRIQGVRSSN